MRVAEGRLYELNLDEGRTSKLIQNGVIMTPNNSPLKPATTKAKRKSIALHEEGKLIIEDGEGRSRHFRNVFLGLLKMRYAAGDKTVVDYRHEAEVEDHEDGASSASDSYDDHEAGRKPSLRRRVVKSKSSSSTTASKANENNDEEDMSLYSDVEMSAFYATRDHLTHVRSLPGSVLDINSITSIPSNV